MNNTEFILLWPLEVTATVHNELVDSYFKKLSEENASINMNSGVWGMRLPLRTQKTVKAR